MRDANKTARAAVILHLHTDGENMSSTTVQHLFVIKAKKVTRRQYNFITSLNYL